MTDEAREQHEEELAERDRIGEKSPSADATFGGDPYSVDPAAMPLSQRMKWISGIPTPSSSSIPIAATPLCVHIDELVVEPKDTARIPAEVKARQISFYRRLTASLRSRR